MAYRVLHMCDVMHAGDELAQAVDNLPDEGAAVAAIDLSEEVTAEEAAAARSAAAAPAAAAPAAAAAAAPTVTGNKRARQQPREAYNILGILEEDSEMASLMEICRAVCHASPALHVHKHCFQQDGTRHVTLYRKLMLTASEAAELRFASSPQLPITIRPSLASAPFAWNSGVYLGIEQHGAALLSALPELLPANRTEQKEAASNMHISLYRARDYPDKEAAKRVWPLVKQALSQAPSFGSARVVRLVLKKEGPSSYSDARVLTQ